jgi:acyl-CoA synthetase (NDP forming)
MLLPLLTGGEPAVRALSAAAGVALARRRTRDRAEQWWSGEAIAMAGLDGPVSAEEAMIWAGDEVALRRFLSAAGLSVPNEFLYDGPSAMELDTKSFTFPVAVKVADQRIVHKAAAGLMRLGVENREAAVRAGDEIWHRFVLGHEGDSPTGLVVQEMVAGGCYEMYVATLCEAGERPVVTVGKGGYSVESAADVSRRLAPVSLGDARGMLAELRTGHQLRDLDVDAAANAIVAIANAALLLRKGVRMMEFNPIIVRPKGQGAFLVDTVIDPLIPGSGMDL